MAGILSIAEALTEALDTASDETRNRLADELVAWEMAYPRSAKQLPPFAAVLVEAIADATVRA